MKALDNVYSFVVEYGCFKNFSTKYFYANSLIEGAHPLYYVHFAQHFAVYECSVTSINDN